MNINIDLGVIEKKLEKYGETKAAEKKIKNCIKDYKKRGVKTTAGGSSMLTDEELEYEAAKLANRIKALAREHGLPASVLADIDSIACTKPYSPDKNTRRVDLYFTNDLSRESLDPDDYDGVVNIIALFNNGYLAQDVVYGFWDHHHATTDSNNLRALPSSDFVYIVSKIGRPALQFMQQAVEEFNNGTGKQDNAMAVLAGIYEEIPTVAPETE